MKAVKMYAISAIIIFSLLAVTCVTRSAPAKKESQPGFNKGFAVLELFTSEGCSSCPPAEALLSKIQDSIGNKPIYVLAYHVDYWDYQGWKDAFSDALYSKRQYNYNSLFTSQVYTPQLIINGQSEYIGSDEPAITKGLNTALAGTSATPLTINGQLSQGKIKLDYTATNAAMNTQLVIAVVQKHAVSQVRRGENKGRTLPHVQIVRGLHEFTIKTKEGSEQINLPAEFNAQDWELIGLLQNKATGVIEAATHVVIK